jgi:hypothetical protein
MKNHASIVPVIRVGRIDRDTVPRALLGSPRARLQFHASGHLATAHVPGDRKRNGRLDLDPRPGSGHFTFLSHAGGSGYYVDQEYRDGAVHTTFCSPWHDGEQSSEPMAWSTWVQAALETLESIV